MRPPNSIWSARIEALAAETQELGAQPLWNGYSELVNYPKPVGSGATRTSNQVRTSASVGNFFTWLVSARQPRLIVEFGTAFGVSGMYWLAGLETNDAGLLLSFEPNSAWASIAERNLAKISTRFKLTCGTFEEHIDGALPRGQLIDVAFIDAIHSSDFVHPQLGLVAKRLSPGGLVLLDDIDFSEDMASCWRAIRADERFAASVEVGGLGLLEFR